MLPRSPLILFLIVKVHRNNIVSLLKHTAAYKHQDTGWVQKIYEPLLSALTFKAKLTAASKYSATLTKSSSTNPLEVSAGVPEIHKSYQDQVVEQGQIKIKM